MESQIKSGKRGRPRDTGKDDSASLIEVADLLTGNPGLRPWRAISQVVRNMPVEQYPNVAAASVVRRLNVKWHKQHLVLMEAAQQRHTEKRDAAARAQAEESMRRLAEGLAAIQAVAAEAALRIAPTIIAVEAGINRWMQKPETVALFEAIGRVQLRIPPEVLEVLAAVAMVRVNPPPLALPSK